MKNYTETWRETPHETAVGLVANGKMRQHAGLLVHNFPGATIEQIEEHFLLCIEIELETGIKFDPARQYGRGEKLEIIQRLRSPKFVGNPGRARVAAFLRRETYREQQLQTRLNTLARIER